jgi:prevent-host-death family protein
VKQSARAPIGVVNISDAKTQLSKLIDEAAAGNDVVIARGGKPVARLAQLEAPKHKLKFGVLKGKIKVPDDFDAPQSSDLLTQFAGS